MNPLFACVHQWPPPPLPPLPLHHPSPLQLQPGEKSLRSNMWECRWGFGFDRSASLQCSGNSVTNQLHALVCVNTRSAPWSSCRSMWCPPPPPSTLLQIWRVMERSLENMLSSQWVYVCSIVLLSNVGRGDLKSAAGTWTDPVHVVSGSTPTVGWWQIVVCHFTLI